MTYDLSILVLSDDFVASRSQRVSLIVIPFCLSGCLSVTPLLLRQQQGWTLYSRTVGRASQVKVAQSAIVGGGIQDETVRSEVFSLYMSAWMT